MLQSFLLIAVTIWCLDVVNACYLHGSNTGECTDDSLDKLWRKELIPYCKRAVTYTACVPKYQVLPPSREFPKGRWFNHSIQKKDAWVGYESDQHIKYRIRMERNSTLKAKGENEYGEKGRNRRRFYKRPDCRRAYKNYFCWTNFPRCDIKRDLTLPMCRSACENYFISCGFGKDIWRCGKTKYFNGYEPEAPIVGIGGNISYLRDYFPGQPFRENKYNLAGEELPICTPAITGAAAAGVAPEMGAGIAVVLLATMLMTAL